MSDADAEFEPTGTDGSDRQYIAAPSARHRSSSSRSSNGRRLVFFSLSAAWGFIAGAGGLLAAMLAVGLDAHLSGWALAGLVPALAVAIAGGCVIAAAYKEAKLRARR